MAEWDRADVGSSQGDQASPACNADEAHINVAFGLCASNRGEFEDHADDDLRCSVLILALRRMRASTRAFSHGCSAISLFFHCPSCSCRSVDLEEVRAFRDDLRERLRRLSIP